MTPERAAVRLGAAFFRWRSLTPLPLLAVGLVLGRPTPGTLLLGVVATCLGEFIRAWSVAHIGARSRTRGDSVGPLVVSGPFARCRNPIYLGNLLVGAGIIWATNVPLLFLAFVLLFVFQYSLVVVWEESRLAAAHGDEFRAYCETAPRWFPRGRVPRTWAGQTPFGLRAVLRSERSSILGQILLFGVLVVSMVLRSA